MLVNHKVHKDKINPTQSIITIRSQLVQYDNGINTWQHCLSQAQTSGSGSGTDSYGDGGEAESKSFETDRVSFVATSSAVRISSDFESCHCCVLLCYCSSGLVGTIGNRLYCSVLLSTDTAS